LGVGARRLALRRLRARLRGTAVGAVEPAALEADADRPEHLAQRPAAIRALGERGVLERLRHLDVLAAGLAGVLVGWHRARSSRQPLALTQDECQRTALPPARTMEACPPRKWRGACCRSSGERSTPLPRGS